MVYVGCHDVIVIDLFLCKQWFRRNPLKRAVKSKQTVYLCNRNKTIINQVRVGLHGGFSVLSSNNFDIQSVTKALRRSVKAHLFCSSPGMDMASLHDHIKYNWISARKRIKTGTYLCIWNIFDFSLAQKSVKCFFRKNR